MRIIGGEWRGRRVRFPAVAGLRPTPDRLRETLFNWLQGAIVGRRVLDLFAGSGALGLEALSRGAAHATFVEAEPRAAKSLLATIATLSAAPERAEVRSEDVFAFLSAGHRSRSYDLVFVDPPYRAGWLPKLCKLLARNDWLMPGAFIYLESPVADGPLVLPAGWQLWRQAHTGAAAATLARLELPPAALATTSVPIETPE